MNTYFIKEGGNIAGPFQVNAFEFTILKPDDLVLKNGDTLWIKASEVEELIPYLNKQKIYFYLNGINKEGPFTITELIKKQLSSETLVYSEGMQNWTPLKNLNQLVEFPTNKNVQSGSTIQSSYRNVNSTENKKKPNKKFKIPSIIFLFIAISIFIWISNLIVQL